MSFLYFYLEVENLDTSRKFCLCPVCGNALFNGLQICSDVSSTTSSQVTPEYPSHLEKKSQTVDDRKKKKKKVFRVKGIRHGATFNLMMTHFLSVSVADWVRRI